MALELPRSHPFTRLHLVPGEQVLWHGYNPTFHRYVEYGLVLTAEALYWYKSPWSFGRWRRFALGDIRSARFDDSNIRPSICLDFGASSRKLHTPHDFYSDEMAYDRKVLAEAVEAVNRTLGPSPPSLVPSNPSLERP
jgi:hypothetical protein